MIAKWLKALITVFTLSLVLFCAPAQAAVSIFNLRCTPTISGPTIDQDIPGQVIVPQSINFVISPMNPADEASNPLTIQCRIIAARTVITMLKANPAITWVRDVVGPSVFFGYSVFMLGWANGAIVTPSPLGYSISIVPPNTIGYATTSIPCQVTATPGVMTLLKADPQITWVSDVSQ